MNIKYIFLLVFYSLFAVNSFAQPKPVFLQMTHDFGAIAEDDGLARCKFAVVNEGTSPLSILSARATCGCTTPEYSRKPIAPGDTSYITVAYDPVNRPGRFTKGIYVETNGNPSKTMLEIKGVVIGSEETVKRRYPEDFGPLKLSRNAFALGEAIMGRMKTVYMEGYNRSSDSLSVGFKNVPPYLELVAAPKVAGPGELVTIIAYVTANKDTEYGVVEDTVTVIPSSGMEYELPTLVVVKEDFSNMSPEKMEKAPVAVPSTERVELGKISHKSDPVFIKFQLKNEGKSDLNIRRLYSVDKGVVAKAKDKVIKKEKSTDIVIIIDPKQQTGSLINSRLQIITNDPVHPIHNVRIVGQWSD